MAVLVCVGSAVMVWVMGNVKLLLEWLTVPLFIIALQLPQGAALYWLVSSLTALAQVLFLFPPIHGNGTFLQCMPCGIHGNIAF